MVQLAGDAYVYHGGNTYAPGDELPDELKHLGDAEDTPVSPASSGDGVDPEFDVEKATVPQLQAELTRLEVPFAEGDRKDALKAKYSERVTPTS